MDSPRCLRLDNDGLYTLLRLPSITCLRADHPGPGVTPSGLSAALKALAPTLEALSLAHGSEVVTDVFLASVAAYGLRSLQDLRIPGCTSVTDPGVAAVGGCPSLTALDVSFCKQVSLFLVPACLLRGVAMSTSPRVKPQDNRKGEGEVGGQQRRGEGGLMEQDGRRRYLAALRFQVFVSIAPPPLGMQVTENALERVAARLPLLQRLHSKGCVVSVPFYKAWDGAESSSKEEPPYAAVPWLSLSPAPNSVTLHSHLR